MTMSISRCTENPISMEEWRKDWHPERMNAGGDSSSVLIVGAGPAGLEAARALSRRGYDVAIAEARGEIGGRVARERLLPGLAAWGRVVDDRKHQISQRPNVETYLRCDLNAAQILDFGFQNICIATGSTWRADGVARQHVVPMPASARSSGSATPRRPAPLPGRPMPGIVLRASSTCPGSAMPCRCGVK